MNSTAPNTLTNNTLSLSNRISGLTSSHFGVFQQTLVDCGDVSIRTLVPATISAIPYRKVLIANIFFRQILALSDTPSISFSDLMTTVASYSSLNMSAAERETETAVVTIRSNFFSCRVFDSPMLLGNILHSYTRISTLWILRVLRSTLKSAVVVDARTPNKKLSIEFSLRLLQTLVYLFPSTRPLVFPTVDTSNVEIPPSPVQNAGFRLGKYTNDMLDELG